MDGQVPGGDYLYTGEGQSGDMTMTRGNLAIKSHSSKRKELHLFDKVSSGYYRYVGRFAYSSHDLINGPDGEGKVRQIILFRLQKV